MPEGDTVFRAARTLHRALAGLLVTHFGTELPELAAGDRRAPIAGRSVVNVAARGKHLLITFSGDLVLRTHMRMHGSWHIYRPGERWRAPRRDARIVLTTDQWIAIAFSVADAEFIARDAIERHARLSSLGSDLLSESYDQGDARRRIREAPARHIAEALLRQQSVAGLGNVYKSEVLFLSRVYPFATIEDVADSALDGLLEHGRRLIRLNVQESSVAAGATQGRVTTGRLNAGEKMWVYGRAGQPCFKCGTRIRSRGETDGRRTYWCPTCQARG